MLAPSTLINDLLLRPDDKPGSVDAPFRYPGWIWLGCIAFGIACWTGVWFGVRALAAVL
jgi:hypothetical protein